jgi:hypothetical protein
VPPLMKPPGPRRVGRPLCAHRGLGAAGRDERLPRDTAAAEEAGLTRCRKKGRYGGLGSHAAAAVALRYVGTQAVWRVGVLDSEFAPHFGQVTWPEVGR